MFSPLTATLVKIFAKGFYRVNAGMLVFLLVTIGSSFFFIETVGDVNLLPAGQLIYYHFIVVITFISSPLMTLVIFFAWLLYTIKSWRYVTAQLALPEHQFLFYSTTAASKLKQFRSWMYVQLAILVPLIVYWLFAGVAGIIFHHYVLPVVILLYLLVLASVSAFLYVRSVNSLVSGSRQSWLLRLLHLQSKPFFSLFLFHLLDKMKLAFVLTKTLSLLTIVGFLNSFPAERNDARVAAIIMLCIVALHSFLIYQDHHFTETQMSFSRNLPYSRKRLFLNFCAVYALLLLPEIVWLFIAFDPIMALTLVLGGLTIALLFRSLLYWFGLNTFHYIRSVFAVYFLFFLVIIFRFWWVFPLNLVITYVLFYLNYYRGRDIESPGSS